MMKGGGKLKAWRLSVGLSQRKAALRVGVSLSSWCDWETGRTQPDPDSIAILATATSASEHAVTLHDFVKMTEAKAS